MNEGSSASNQEEDAVYSENEYSDHDIYLVKAVVAATAKGGCIGAIDGTHIPCVPRCENADAWINRKGFHSHNVLAACSFDMKFTYMLAIYKGSSHDARMLDEVIAFHGFPIPPPGGNVDVNADYVFDDGIDDTSPSTGTQQHGSSRGAMNQIRDMITDDMWERYQSSPWYKST
ncbi:hypothetical protein TIFTF001_021062 [Ficus carica]|uniref:DDE Tnp4 domain-containing protein n=1 Tax=Ficus carica TaxID=3494 RepID=A0AA88AYJ4_FICCA|nr:hypothetical protein TIFTF001_021062 [Ficus carica]